MGIGIAALLAAAGCDAGTTDLEWRITFEREADREAARRVEASIRRDGCDGEILHEIGVAAGEAASMDPPPLAPGTYAFRAEAIDATCRRIASACEVVTLPSDGDAVELVLSPTGATTTCGEGVCDDGICDPCPVGGCIGDAGVDGGADAGLDAGADAGPSLAAPVVVAPWNGMPTGSALADPSAGVLADPPLQPEIHWEAVADAAAYRVELVRCDARLAVDCDFSSPTQRIVVASGERSARPGSALAVETTTAPLGARYAFRVGACAEAAGSGCTFAAPRSIEVGRLREDIDGDGDGDLFLVAEMDDGSMEVRRVPLTSATSTVHSAPQIRSVGWIGDYDGDGVAELAAATDGAPGGRIVYMDDLVEAGAVTETTAGADLGRSIVGLDDVDGDGYADFAASAPGENEVRVFLGGPTFDGARARTVSAPSGITDFGASIARAGDRDGDGLADLAVAARAGAMSGRVFVFSLAGGSPRQIESHMLNTGEISPSAGLPFDLSGGQDVDGDGVPDIAVGRSEVDNLTVIFASDTDSISDSGDYGTSVALGDLDGTGAARVLVGAPTFVDSGFGMDGTSFHVSRDGSDFFSVRIRFIDFSSEARFGEEVTTVDVDGDGRDDAVVLDGNGGTVHVVYYDADTMTIDATGDLIPASGSIARWTDVAR